MRMADVPFTLGNQSGNRLKFYYGITFVQEGQDIDQFYEQEADTLMQQINPSPQMNMVVQDVVLSKEI